MYFFVFVRLFVFNLCLFICVYLFSLDSFDRQAGVRGTVIIRFSIRALIYFWYLKGGHLFETGRLFGTGRLFLF